MNSRLLRAIVLLLALKFLAAEAYRSATAPSGIRNFEEYNLAAQRLNRGEQLYVPEQGPTLMNQYVSSPLVPLLLRPLARLPAGKAFRVWTGMNVALLALSVALYCWAADVRLLETAVPGLLMLCTAFRYWPTILELAMGNVDIILLAAVCGMCVCNRYGRWVWLALLAALAALTKTWMIGALFYLMARRQWRAAIIGAAAFVAGLALLFSLVGWKEFPQLLMITRRYSSQPTIVSHSVAGIARMFFSANPIMTPLVNSSLVHLLALALGYGALVAGLLYLWWRGPEMNAYQSRLCLGLTALALVLGSPVSHQYYFVLALPLLWALLTGAAGDSRAWVMTLAAFALYLVFSVPTPGDPLPDAFKHGLRSLEVAVSFVTGMLLWGLGLFAVMREFPEYRVKRVAVVAAPMREEALKP